MAAAFVIMTVAIFVAGAFAGIIAVVSVGIRREERHLSLTRQAPDRVSQGARLLTGLYIRRRTHSSPASADREGCRSSRGSPGQPGST